MLPEIPTFPPPPRRSAPLAVVVAVSMASGIAGALLLFWFFPEIRQARIPPGAQTVVVERPGKVQIEESARLRELSNQNKRIVAGLYHKGAGLKIGEAVIYPEKQLIGAAVFLTADGWFASVADADIKAEDVLLFEGHPYPIENIVSDPSSSYILGKISAGRLLPATFIDSENRYAGMTLWTLIPGGEIVKTALHSDKLFLGSLDDSPVQIISSDKLSLALSADTQRGFLPGTPVFDLAGQLVGLISPTASGASAILPADVLQAFLNSVLKFGETRRPYLGISYVYDYNSADPNLQPGAIIYGAKPNTGIAANSPAAKAGLKQGDRIVSVNGAPLASPASLFAFVQQANPGDSVILGYTRQGKEYEVSIILSKMPSAPLKK